MARSSASRAFMADTTGLIIWFRNRDIQCYTTWYFNNNRRFSPYWYTLHRASTPCFCLV